MDGAHRSDIHSPAPAARGRPRKPMRPLLVVLVLTCSAIYAADRAAPFVAGIGQGWNQGWTSRSQP